MSFTGQKSQVNQQQHLNSTYFIDYPTPLQIPENIKTKMSTFHYTRNKQTQQKYRTYKKLRNKKQI